MFHAESHRREMEGRGWRRGRGEALFETGVDRNGPGAWDHCRFWLAVSGKGSG